MRTIKLNKKQRLKQSKGITLIALVITIIVLLILAGVTISTLIGENGILTQAENAKTETTKAEAEEQFALIANEWMIEKNIGNKTLEELLNEKVKEGKLTNVTDNEDGTYTIEINGYKKIINQNGKLSDVFDAEEWDKTAAEEDCFIWGSDTEGEEGYDVVVGYTSKIDGCSKLRFPSRCTRINLKASSYTNAPSDSSRSFCSSVKTVELPNTVIEIGDMAFASSSWSTGFDVLESIEIPSSVEVIGYGAFWYCETLKDITIGNNVTSIGWYAFSECTSLTNITIPDSVTSIDSRAFGGCTSLTNVTIGNSVTSIGDASFSGCTSLTSIDIPDSVTSIGSQAFLDCTSLASIIIPNSVTSIDFRTFSGCISLTDVTIGNSVTSIGTSVFDGCTGLTNVEIPNSVTSIGELAFLGCTGLTSITIPDSVTIIDSGAFSGCISLTDVTIGNSVTSIGSQAFLDCTSLTSIVIPNSVTSIGDDAFYECTSLTSIVIPNSVTSIGWGAFYNWTSNQVINIQGYSSAPKGWDSSWNNMCSATINWNQ